MAKEKKKEQQYYNGIAIDSQEEIMAIMYFEELIEAGYVEKLERAQTYALSEPLFNRYQITKQLKTKDKVETKEQKMLHEHVYTPEFKIHWTQKGYLTFTDDIYLIPNEKMIKPFISCGSDSLIEVKPGFDQNNMTRLFVINQKWMWDKHREFVNLIQPHKLFEETFTPKAYLTTPTGKQRVIHWKVRTLEQYVNSLNNQ